MSNYLIHNAEEFQLTQVLLGKVVNTEKELPYYVFNKDFQHFSFLSFDYFFYEEVHSGLLNFLEKINEEYFIFSSLNPSSQEFWEKYRYGHYGMSRTSLNTSFKDFFENTIGKSIAEEPVSDISTLSNSAVYFSESSKWCMYGSREFEFVIVGFESLNLKKVFDESFEVLYGLDEAIDDLYVLRNLDQKCKDMLRENYGCAK